MLQTISITVSGKVQGVYYRQTTQEKATSLGITGTVKNLPNRNVYIIATGTSEQLDKLVAWCKQGPSRAEVSQLQITPLAITLFEEFKIVK